MSLILFSCFLNFTHNEVNSFNESSINRLNINTVHEPIEVLNDTAFVLYGFEGEGTKEDPYIIENYYIESFGFLSNAIYVTGTTAHFIIRNCYMVAEYLGINVHAVASNTALIFNNTITSGAFTGCGIGASSVSGCSIINNTCFGHSTSIHTNEANNITISGNSAGNAIYHGIGIRYTSSSKITDNIIQNCSMFGVAIVEGASWFNLIYNNDFIDNGNAGTYNIDNESFGNITSQAYDEGNYNTWHNEETETGNKWSDYSGKGDYLIDGPSGSSDKYPEKYTSQSGSIVLFYLGILSILIAGIVILRRKKNSK